MKEVAASLYISMYVDCPNEECGNCIDLLDPCDTDNYDHNDCGDLLKQMFPEKDSHESFECDEVVCSQCKTEFNVKGLIW